MASSTGAKPQRQERQRPSLLAVIEEHNELQATMGILKHLHFMVLLVLPVVVTSFALPPSRTAVSTKIVGRPPAFISSSALADSSGSVDDAKDKFEDAEQSLQQKVKSGLKTIDTNVLKRVIRIGNHLPTLITLIYFGLISMVSNMHVTTNDLSPLASALARPIGPTTSAEFSSFFPTKVTPATFVFYAWPLISMLQLLTVGISALRAGRPLLSHGDLTCLSVGNMLAAAWLVVSSRTLGSVLPLASVLILPLVPLITGFPLRNMRTTPIKANWRNSAYQLYSSFTTIASLLAMAVELQYGGRVPFLGGRGEVVAAIFLSMYTFVVRYPGQGYIKRYVNAIAMGGIVTKRVMDGLTLKSALSVSFLGSCGVLFYALKKLPNQVDDDEWEGNVDAIKEQLKKIKQAFTPPDDDTI